MAQHDESFFGFLFFRPSFHTFELDGWEVTQTRSRISVLCECIFAWVITSDSQPNPPLGRQAQLDCQSAGVSPWQLKSRGPTAPDGLPGERLSEVFFSGCFPETWESRLTSCLWSAWDGMGKTQQAEMLVDRSWQILGLDGW